MTKVLAQGVFDVIHPGHLHYLEKSSELGTELVVVVARDSRVQDRKDLAFDEKDRRDILESIEIVDRAVLGKKGNIYGTVAEQDPDVITLGYDQSHDESEVKEMAEEATGHEVQVVRISRKGAYSSSDIKG